jgi:hypothetical protein
LSIAVISRVLESPEPKGAARLVLLVYADRCDATGGNCFPSLEDVGRRAAMSRSQAQKHTQALIRAGFLEVVANEHGGAPGTTRRVRVCLEKLAPATDKTGSEKHLDGSQKAPKTGSETAIQTANPNAPKRLELVVGASGPIGEGLAPSPRAEAPGGVDSAIWIAVSERAAFRKTPAALEALAGEVSKAQAAGENPDALTRRLQVLLEPGRQHLTRLPFDPSASTSSPATKAAPLRQPRKAYSKTDYGRDTRSHGLSYDD